MKKIYCKDCKYFKRHRFMYDVCTKIIKGDYYSPDTKVGAVGNPASHNCFNDCEYFEVKE